MADDPGARGMLQNPTAYSDCLLMVGIFGMASLAGTPLSDLTTMFKRGARATVKVAAVGVAAAVAAAAVEEVAEVAVAAAGDETMSCDLPVLGVGIGFREPFLAELFRHRDGVDFLEITADHYLDAPEEKRPSWNCSPVTSRSSRTASTCRWEELKESTTDYLESMAELRRAAGSAVVERAHRVHPGRGRVDRTPRPVALDS